MYLDALPTSSPLAYTIVQAVKSTVWGSIFIAKHDITQQQVTLLSIPLTLAEQSPGFAARFALLKYRYATLSHPNLRAIIEMEVTSDGYYIIKQAVETEMTSYRTLAKYLQQPDLLSIAAWQQVFTKIAFALAYLEKQSFHYSQQGILPSHILPQHIYLTADQTDFNLLLDPLPEVFLFLNDHPNSYLQYCILQTNSDDALQNDELFYAAAFSSPNLPQTANLSTAALQYSFGAFCYYALTQSIPKGFFSPPSSWQMSLSIDWDRLILFCLNALLRQQDHSMETVVSHIQKINDITSIEKIETAIPIRSYPIYLNMALIACQNKIMVGANDGPKIEQPCFRARVTPFYIDHIPVTCAQFRAFLPSYQTSTYSKGDHHPATLISLEMAKSYCQWRSQQEGLPLDTYRLPTEYEWEAAVRSDQGHQYPWDDTPQQEQLHCNQLPSAGTVAVDHHAALRFGLYGMLGNVWEWTATVFKSHPFAPPQKLIYTTPLYVVKGGCWLTPQTQCRASLRAAFQAHERKSTVGFRCVRTAIPK